MKRINHISKQINGWIWKFYLSSFLCYKVVSYFSLTLFWSISSISYNCKHLQGQKHIYYSSLSLFFLILGRSFTIFVWAKNWELTSMLHQLINITGMEAGVWIKYQSIFLSMCRVSIFYSLKSIKYTIKLVRNILIIE